MTKDTGGNAFPTTEFIDGIGEYFDSGMTLRDYFAAKAMQALITHYGHETLGGTVSCIEESSYEIADELLELRNK
jgi:hypothetical protein